jgi:hypothetical protein
MLALIFMKNTCSHFADSKQVGMLHSKQRTMFANLVFHFFPQAVVLLANVYPWDFS